MNARNVASVSDAYAVPTGEALLEVRGVTKSFGPTKAVVDASFTVYAGEVLAIVGENGSGKSTLMKILAGVHRPDSGELMVRGSTLRVFGSPRESSAAGIGTVFQEILVVESQSVLDNIWIGAEGLFRPVPVADRRRRAAEAIEALLGRSIDLDTLVERLPLSDRQACSIARILVRDPDVIVLDEATSALDVATRDRLFDLLRRRSDDGKSALFISHRMDEIGEIADRVTVMRSGVSVATVSKSEATTDTLVRHMTGDDTLVPASDRVRAEPGSVVLDVPGLRLRTGEIVGVGGLEGQGQDAFLHSLVAADESAAYVPRDRRGESIFAHMSIVENFALPTLQDDRRFGLVSWRRARTRLEAFVSLLGIKLGQDRDAISTLSGGNQQKVVIARWLAAKPKVLVLNDPTRGIDLGAKRDIYRVFEELASEGMAIVMLSTEVDELVELMDRVLIFREGSIVREFDRSELSRDVVVRSFFGEVPARG